MAKKKAETLTEKQIDKAYEIKKGFNIPGDEGEIRFNVTKKPQIVFEKDFDKDVWKELVKNEAVVLVEDTEVKKDEIVVLEIIEA